MLEMSSLRVMVKRSKGKRKQKETEKQQHVIARENNLFKVLLQKAFEITTESSPTSLTATVDCAANLPAGGIPYDATIKLAGLLPIVNSNTFCSKTCKMIVFCHIYVLLFHCFFLLLFSSAFFNHNSQRRYFQRYIPM